MEEGADEVGVTAQAAHRLAEAGLGDGQVGWTEAGEGVLLQPSLEPFVGIEFGDIGRQTVIAEAIAVFDEPGVGSVGAMGAGPIPKQEEGSRKAAHQMFAEARDLGTRGGTRNQIR